MTRLTELVKNLPEFHNLTACLEGGRSPVALSGLSTPHRANLAAALAEQGGRPTLLLCGDEMEGRRLARDLAALSGKEVLTLPQREMVFHETAGFSHQWEQRRLRVFWAMFRGEAPFVIATPEALLQRTLPPALLEGQSAILKRGGTADLTELAERLADLGYVRCQQVEGEGQFAIRGGILDVFSPAQEQPVRMELWGDEIDSIALFDPQSQRRVTELKETLLLPARETLPWLAPGGVPGLAKALEKLVSALERDAKAQPELIQTLKGDMERLREQNAFATADRYLPLIYPKLCCGADYLPSDALVLWTDTPRVQESAKNYQWRLNEETAALIEGGVLHGKYAVFAQDGPKLWERLGREYPMAYLDSFLAGQYPVPPREIISLGCKLLPSFGASLETAIADLRHYQNRGFAAVVLCGAKSRADVLDGMLREQGLCPQVDYELEKLPAPGQIVLAAGGLSGGMEYPGWAVLTEGEAAQKKSARKRTAGRRKLDSFTDLTPGDLVVHETHGVGRYEGLVRMKVDGVEKDYIKLVYAGGDSLYVPATQLDMVSKYIGSGGTDIGERRLNKLGGSDWGRAKKRAKKATKELAKGLIDLYAQRQRQPGHAFSPDDPWQQEFEDRFPYVETEDQLRCVREIKADMERPVPMDRLLCGDVGYGKTEVALRAVMKCVLEGKQAAILAPTTVLARQHYQTVIQRFEGFPVQVGLLSRFQSPKETQQIRERLRTGEIDILVGTHRLFSKELVFRDLGLLVVDEEQRFGVSQKERLKEMTRQVDVLTLSATPIPRTLNMALSGIRDMSLIEEPPQDRQPVQTYVLEHNWSVLADAIRRELGRGGQVYYLHNRVETISRTASQLRKMLGEDVRIGIAHGQMEQRELSSIMNRVVEGQIDVLVCTTIIETGIDIANVNTLIIEDADRMGLAQLHQIRGRVGRSNRRAYAYMTYRQGKVLSEASAQRLSAIREFAEFGSGFKIAMRDLEIRGAGNLLGPEQSGFLVSVGYDLYLRLLEEAVLEEQGKPVTRTEEVAADLTVSANIPEGYVSSEEERMDLYRRMARIRTEEEADDLMDELIDRYGDPPRAVNNLVSVALLRSAAARAGFLDITQRELVVSFGLREPDVQRIVALSNQTGFQGRIMLSATSKPRLSLRLRKGEDPLRMSRRMVEAYERLGSEEPLQMEKG